MKTILVDAVHCFVIVGQGIFQEMFDLLEKYPNRKILMTGANDEEMKTYGLIGMPYEIFTLKGNPKKSDPAYYKKMLEHFGLTKDDVVYFEHNLKAVESARSADIMTYHYDNKTKDLAALDAFLKANLYTT